MRYYYSIISRDYVNKGLLLYNSLKRWDEGFHFYMICLQDEVKELLQKMNLNNATLISLSDIEKEDVELLQVKKSRSDKEYAWTAKASACLYILKYFNEVDRIVWLDGDTYFHSSSEPIFEEWGDYSIFLTEEKWRGRARVLGDINGIYNTGFMGFKRDEYGLECLEWFRERLLEWCFDSHEKGLWSDQVYVNDWPSRFKNVGILRNMGVNVTPYIIKGCTVTKTENNDIYVNGQKLVFFHYYGFKYFNGNEFELCSYKMSFCDEVIKWIYLPYIHAYKEMAECIHKVDMNFYMEKKAKDYFIRNYFNLRLNELVPEDIKNLCTIVTKDYLVRGLALYYSLKRSSSKFHLWICCIDDIAYNLLSKMDLDSTTLISLKSIKDEKLSKLEKKRQTNEFCWTLKAPFILYLLKNNYKMKSIFYIDADIFFFKDIEVVYNDWGDSSIYLSKLWMSPVAEKRFGKYSAGLIGFKRDKKALKCIKWWRKKCLKWCYNKIQEGRWSDQKYLDLWPGLFSGIKISENRGINSGPWNIKRYRVHRDGDTVYCNNYELVAYHYSGFTILSHSEFKLCNRKKIPANVENLIYQDYLKEIREIFEYTRTLDYDLFSLQQ